MKLYKFSKEEIEEINNKLSALATDSKRWNKEFSNPNSWMNKIVYQVIDKKPVAKVLREAILQGGGIAVYHKEKSNV